MGESDFVDLPPLDLRSRVAELNDFPDWMRVVICEKESPTYGHLPGSFEPPRKVLGFLEEFDQRVEVEQQTVAPVPGNNPVNREKIEFGWTMFFDPARSGFETGDFTYIPGAMGRTGLTGKEKGGFAIHNHPHLSSCPTIFADYRPLCRAGKPGFHLMAVSSADGYSLAVSTQEYTAPSKEDEANFGRDADTQRRPHTPAEVADLQSLLGGYKWSFLRKNGFVDRKRFLFDDGDPFRKLTRKGLFFWRWSVASRFARTQNMGLYHMARGEKSFRLVTGPEVVFPELG